MAIEARAPRAVTIAVDYLAQLVGRTDMDQTKKIINDGDAAVDEMIEGALAAYPHIIALAPGTRRSIVALHGPRQGKVGLVVGGGSGHEPAFFGYVGRGLADAAAVGNVFASPSPDPILQSIRAANQGAGVLVMFGNYAGDVMNFGMATEMASFEDIECRTVLTTDDVASAALAERAKRRGVAGNVFIFKIAGAACDRLYDLEACARIARKANDATATIGVALSGCSLPQTRRPNFIIPPAEMEIGMGIHGEPGIARAPLVQADALVDQLYEQLAADMSLSRNERVAVLVNSLGATTQMELFIISRRLNARLRGAGIAIHRTWVGPYCTSLEMAGASITITRLDGELQELLDHPCDAALFRGGPLTWAP